MRTKVMDTEIALKRAIQSTKDPDHRETSVAMYILVAANVVGADVWRLSDRTGYQVADIREFENNLREARLWIGAFVDSLEWQVEDERQMMFVLFMHAQVARGLLRRRLEGNFAIYLDHAGHEQARIPIPEGADGVCG
jgi:hypothetical protein